MSLCGKGHGNPCHEVPGTRFLCWSWCQRNFWDSALVCQQSGNFYPICTLSLCGLPIHGWVAMVPKCFHFATPLTADRRISLRKRISELLGEMVVSCYTTKPGHSEPFRTSHSFTNIYKGRLHSCGLCSAFVSYSFKVLGYWYYCESFISVSDVWCWILSYF